ncbi:hypothetical protein B0H17DRAFT_1198480 [Mycena rosella]|uniref:Uncharacterized protein n=1 Tax=Mycena rosella TaxID=1033263 RepID=A0AAD7DN20_MYCRO|nr:hypothetical protein B0H17DRAFT_1198480 [Mycena rosella]
MPIPRTDHHRRLLLHVAGDGALGTQVSWALANNDRHCFTTPFDIPPLRDFTEDYRGMHALDREKDLHSPELYAVWNAKPYFLDEAVKAVAHNYTDWPSLPRVHDIWEEGSALTGEKQEDLLFYPVCRVPDPSYRHWQEHTGPVDAYFSEASFFGGSAKTISWWRDIYYAYHDHYLRQGMFVGKDQNLIFSLFLLFPSRVIGVWIDDPEAPAHKELLPLDNDREGLLGTCGPREWYYYAFWLASPAARESMHRIWENAARWSWGSLLPFLNMPHAVSHMCQPRSQNSYPDLPPILVASSFVPILISSSLPQPGRSRTGQSNMTIAAIYWRRPYRAVVDELLELALDVTELSMDDIRRLYSYKCDVLDPLNRRLELAAGPRILDSGITGDDDKFQQLSILEVTRQFLKPSLWTEALKASPSFSGIPLVLPGLYTFFAMHMGMRSLELLLPGGPERLREDLDGIASGIIDASGEEELLEFVGDPWLTDARVGLLSDLHPMMWTVWRDEDDLDTDLKEIIRGEPQIQKKGEVE